jgi:Tfp pilus assembly protein PilX
MGFSTMRQDMNHFKNESGTALVATLMFLLAMGVLSTALVFTVNNEMKTSTAYKRSQQAFYVANSGVNNAVRWFVNSYAPHTPAADYDATQLPVTFGGNNVLLAAQTGSTSIYPENPRITAFSTAFSDISLEADANNSGTYAVNATLLRYRPAQFIDPVTFITYTSAIERWRINSTGYWGSSANPLSTAQITATIENSGNALFDKALWGKQFVDLGGTVLLDSYNPALGPYGGTNIGNNGAIGSNGYVTTNGNVTIDGSVAYGPSGYFSQGSNTTVTGSTIQLSQPHYFPPLPSFTVGTTDYNPKNGTVTLNPGQYGNVTIGPNGTLALNPGTYYFDSITEGSTASLSISGETTIFVKNTLDLSGQGVMNSTGDPTRLTIYYSGTNDVKMVGGSEAYVEVYAPNAALKLNGNAAFYGSFIGNSITVGGTPDIHFDEGCLNDNLVQRPFRLITWSQDVYQ